jgi:hypothetical protein
MHIDVGINGDRMYLWVSDPDYSWFTHIALPTVLITTTDPNNQWYVGALKEEK